MVFHYRGIFDQIDDDGRTARSFTSGIHAQSAGFTRFVVAENFGMFGVYLYPFAIPQLFARPASELTGLLPSLHELFGVGGKELEERVMLAATAGDRISIVSAFLLQRLDRAKPEIPSIFSAVGHIIRSRGLIDIGTLAGRYATSTRTFERRFKESAGLPPKLYSRIIRFQSTVREYGQQNRSLTDIAYDFGYYDQSHFIHEFKEFSGYNPKAFFAGRAEGADYLEV
jgi:AraC-like DNA-binding protein